MVHESMGRLPPPCTTAKAELICQAEIVWQAKSAAASLKDIVVGAGKATNLAAYQRSLPLAAVVAGGKLAGLRETDSLLAQLTACKTTPPSGTVAALAAMKHEMAALNMGVTKSLANLGPTKMMGGFQGAMAALMESTPDFADMRESEFPFRWALTLPFHALGCIYQKWKARDLEGMYRLLTAELIDDETAEAIRDGCRSVKLIEARADFIADVIWAHQCGKYTLSVPAAMAQTEGILRNIGKAVGAIGPPADGPCRSVRQVLNQSVRKMAELAAHADGEVAERRLPSLKGMYSGPFLTFLVDDYFRQRRNPVMHGNTTDYATAELSAECLLALNEVIDCAVDVQHWVEAREGSVGTPNAAS